MPNAHDADIRQDTPDAPAPGDAVVVAPNVDVDARTEVIEAEVLDAEDADKAEPMDPDAGDELDAELVEGDSEDADATAGARPSVSGRLAKPHKTKDADAKHARRKERRPGFARRVALGIIVALLAALLVGMGLFCWQKWMRFDDAADIQGVWKVQSTGDTIVFNGRDLKLTKGISYEYRLDEQEKTITYSFGEYAGGGHYYFSGDRQVLIIIDGDERLGSLAEVGFLPEDIVENDDANDEKTVLVKVSDDTSAEPSGTATGVSTGKTMGEREYVVKPEPSTSSSSEKKKSKSTKSEEDEEESDKDRGFVDEDGDGYDDETDLEYEDFLEYQQSLQDEDKADDEDAEDEDEGASEDEEADVDAEWTGEADDEEEYE